MQRVLPKQYLKEFPRNHVEMPGSLKIGGLAKDRSNDDDFSVVCAVPR